MSIRLATPDDAAQVAALWNAVIQGSLATFTTDLKTQADIAKMITSRSAAFWVAEDHDLVGFATYGPFRAGPGYAATVEHTVILRPSAQGQGIGRALMRRMQDAARAAGLHVMVAGISSANPGAIAFHAKLGFAQTGHLPQVGRKAGQWLDLILMQKTL